MTILVTGAAGYVGNNTVRRLVELGKPVRAMVHNVEKAQKRLGDVANRIEIVQADVTDPDSLKRVMKDVSAVIHLVAIALEKGSVTYEKINYQGTVNVVNAAKAAGVRRIVHMSQNGANSSLPYRFLKSKGEAQEYVESSKLEWTVMRPSAIFGPQDEFFNSLARLIRLTPVIFPLIGGGTAEFQPVSVYDVVEATVKSLDDATTIGKEYGLGGPEVLTMGEIERRILNVLRTRRILFNAPVGLLRVPVFIMEKTLPGTPVNSSLLELLAIPNTIEDNALVSHFKTAPRPFSGDNIAYLRDNSIGDTLRRLFTGASVN